MNRPGPDACYCRRCIMNRWRTANRMRRRSGNFTPIPRPQFAESKHGKVRPGEGCSCKLCQYNRKLANAKRRPARTEDDLDRRALENWPVEWGQRSA